MKTTDFSERFLYHIWDAGHLTGELHTVSGKSLKIISAGRYSNAAGPDFREAVISLERDLVRGDVEIHKTTYDWKAHGHSDDPNFCNLVLHVVYEHNVKLDYTIDKNGNSVEIFAMQDFLDDDIKRIFAGYQENPELPQEKFCTFFAGHPPELLQPLLQKCGMLRLQEKKKRFAAEQYFTGFNQLVYQGILEALGYSNNKYQMLQLADAISYSQLRNFAENGMTEHQMIAIWLGASGMIDRLPGTFPQEYVLKWKELYARQNFFNEALYIDWKLFRIRPVNHPAVRLLQMTDIIYESLKGSLFNNFINLFSFPVDNFKISAFYKRIYDYFIKPSDFLPDRYRIGKTRLDTIFINIILPLALLYAEKNDYRQLTETTILIYKNYHALPENHLTKSMTQFMDASQVKLAGSRAIYQQALLYLYNSFCRYHTCNQCREFKNLNLLKM
jgi:hypothetical protein